MILNQSCAGFFDRGTSRLELGLRRHHAPQVDDAVGNIASLVGSTVVIGLGNAMAQ